jgi:alpha-tubulin suppressor-like RCC1 family protein
MAAGWNTSFAIIGSSSPLFSPSYENMIPINRTDDYKVYSWGLNTANNLGILLSPSYVVRKPMLMEQLNYLHPIQVAAGRAHTLFISGKKRRR